MPRDTTPSRSLHYAGGTLNRAVEKRNDTSWVAERLNDHKSRIVPVWRNRNLVSAADEPVAILHDGDAARTMIDMAEHVALLGLIDQTNAVFAADLSDHDDHVLAPLIGSDASFRDLREVGPMMALHEANMLGFARGVMYWHRKHLFCGICGSPTASERAGHMRRCTNADCAREHYPRTDPAVIMLVTRDTPAGEVCLLAHKVSFPKGRFSILAGYVDPGESLEEAVAREVLEETGVVVTDVEYRASQPWPFPSNLMLGFRAKAVTEEITCDEEELEEAYWFSRDDLRHFPEKGYQLSRPDSIARWLIDEWLNEGR